MLMSSTKKLEHQLYACLIKFVVLLIFSYLFSHTRSEISIYEKQYHIQTQLCQYLKDKLQIFMMIQNL